MSWVTDVRLDAIARLQAAGTIASSRVYDSTTAPLADSDSATPAIVVQTSAITREARGNTGATMLETVTLDVECYSTSKGTDAANAAQLDTLEEQAHVALWQDAAWQRQYTRVVYGRTATEVGLQSSRRAGFATSSYQVSRHVQRPATTGDELTHIVAEVTAHPSITVIGTVEVDL